jgi:hypothetical protein
MRTFTLHLLFRIICFTLAFSSLADIAMNTQQVNQEVAKEMTNNGLENIDDNFSKHELASVHIHIFKNSGLIEPVIDYTDHYALQYKPEITPPPPKVS